MIYVMRKDAKDRNQLVRFPVSPHFQLTEDYASIITNVCAYCDLCTFLFNSISHRLVSYLRSVDFTCLLQYCINLNNSSITPILLTYVENLVSTFLLSLTQDIRQPCQLQSALTYLVLSRTRENCKNPAIVTSLVKRIRVAAK